jgi:hypothetical protein
MILQALRDRPPPELTQSLEVFDSRFSYPLGSDRTFRISHGEDYPRFFRSMGDARCFVAEKKLGVIGAIGVAIRTLTMPDGYQSQAAYIGDLKVEATARGSLVFARLAAAAAAWARPQVNVAFGVVMGGNAALPTQYTGRAGIPAFLPVGKIVVLRFPTDLHSDRSAQVASAADGESQYRLLGRGRFFASGGNPAERSEVEPIWLHHRDSLACGRLEDTRRGKRLIDSDGVEMQSAHLACFAWRTAQSASDLINSARYHAARLGFPALFVAVSEPDMAPLGEVLGPIDKLIAPATIYAAGVTAEADWIINSSEI